MCIRDSFNADASDSLGAYGAAKVLNVSDDSLKIFNAKAYANAIAQAVEKESATTIILSSSADTKFLASLLTGP